MNKSALSQHIFQKQSFLCVGLDPDLSKLPPHLDQSPKGVLAFNKAIIEATAPYAVAYKPNLAFYEAMGSIGWEVLEETIAAIPKDCFVIADAKRGDIGNTARQYAKAFFEHLHVDALTISPYMGHDSVEPYLEYPDKWVIVLAATSNPGAADLQNLASQGAKLYEHVIFHFSAKGTEKHTMFVVGATQPKTLHYIRKLVPEHFLLVPGVGAQGGSLQAVAEAGLNPGGGLLVNVGRDILYTSKKENFAELAGARAHDYQKVMAQLLEEHCA